MSTFVARCSLACLFLIVAGTATGASFRPPAVPLVTIDPYTNCWSMGDKLAGDWPRHWTGHVHAMCGFIRVDGKAFRFMGAAPQVPQECEQRSLAVRATQTVYQFRAGEVNLTVTFTSPLLVNALDVMSRPASYITFQVVSVDAKPHSVQIYFDATAEWAVNQPSQPVSMSRAAAQGLDAMRVGTVDQRVLATKGDDVRIDWGYLYVAAPAHSATTAILSDAAARGAFARDERQRAPDDAAAPRAANDRWPVLSVTFDLGAVAAQPASRHVVIAYDDLYSVEYFGQKLPAWWRRDPAMTPEKMLADAEHDYPELVRRCDDFDQQVMETAARAGSPQYSELCQLAYRQSVAAHKLVADPAGRPLLFSKENFSNGSIGTVDVTYPSAPLFLVYNPELLRAMLEPICYYSESGRWQKAFAAHDVGTYPLANGQTYPEDMPVEECGNMLILTAAAQADGNADFVRRHWKVLTTWAEYLKREGFDPANQLCTDDFAGHLAHNANLSIKAIVALGSYGKLAKLLDHDDVSQQYLSLAREFASQWMKAAAAGDHTALAFGRTDTWSQKYNLVWDAH
ncbi:MAG TPA: DUF4965 domain-containing protein, partial [Pirellulales bacterium]|nr:DUF4965 domain-containing protein [Pirellulales bacterium]